MITDEVILMAAVGIGLGLFAMMLLTLGLYVAYLAWIGTRM
mgnify:CR=1 FL=1